MAKEASVLPRLVMGVETLGVENVVGGKRYCNLHGKAYMLDKDDTSFCPACRAKNQEPKVYKNIVLVSRTQARATKTEGGAWDGKQGSKIFIGEVISVHFVGTEAELADEEARLCAEHGVKHL